MLKRYYILAILLVLLPSFGQAQYATNYSIKEGLPSNHIYKVTQDNNGFIWVITDNGIAKYNGTEFKVFTTKEGLPTNDVWEIATTPDGKVWFFCKASKVGYIENDKVHSFEGEEKGIVFFPLKIIEIENTILFESKNNWYFLNTDNKWEAIDEIKKHPLFKIKSEVEALIKAEKPVNIIHFRAKDSLICWLKRDTYMVFNSKTKEVVDGKETYRFNHQFSDLARINLMNGSIQITDTSFVALLDSKYKIAKTASIPSSFNSHHASIDKTGNLWAVSFQNGVYKIPSVYQKIAYFFPSEKIENIEKAGNDIVVNVFDKGYYRYNKSKLDFIPFIEEKGVLHPLSVIDSLQKTYFVHKLEVVSYSFNTHKVVKRTKIKEGIKQMVYYDGFLWGLGSYDIKKMKESNFDVVAKFPAVGMNKLFMFNDKMLIGSTDGLKVLKDTVVTPIVNDTLFQKPIHNIVSLNRDWVIICTEGYGAYATNTLQTIYLPNTQYLNIKDAFVVGDSIWLATNEGLVQFLKKGHTFQFVKNVTEEMGLATRRVNSVLVDEDYIFMGTDDGLVVFPLNIKAPSQFLDIYFDTVQFNGETLSLSNNEINYATHNSLRVKIGAINFSEKKTPVAFEYKLEPLQNQWQETTSSTLNFSDLPPNEYQLQLASGDYQKSFSFSVRPLWWQTITAKILFSLLVIGLVLFVLQMIRKRELKKKTAKLNAEKKLAEYELYALRSQMNPHFVFNSLTAIQYYINENDFENSEKYLVKFSKLIRQFFEISKEEEITLENEIALLQNYLEIEKLRFKDKLSFTIEVDPKLNVTQSKIPTMLLQPVVENAVNHGIFNKEENGTINLYFSYIKPKEFSVEILDDGVGFEKTKKQRNGKISSSVILKDRISILNQSQHWDITYSTVVAFSEASDKGNKATFTIKHLK